MYRELANRLLYGLQLLGDYAGEREENGLELIALELVEIVSVFEMGDVDGDHDEDDNLGGEGLGGGDGHFTTAVEVDSAVDIVGDQRADCVDDSDGEESSQLALFQTLEDICGLPRLTDENSAGLSSRQVLLAELARLVALNAIETFQVFEHLAPELARVQTTPTRDDQHVLDLPDPLLLALQSPQLYLVSAPRHLAQTTPVAHHLQDGLRLLVDFLLEKVLVRRIRLSLNLDYVFYFFDPMLHLGVELFSGVQI